MINWIKRLIKKEDDDFEEELYNSEDLTRYDVYVSDSDQESAITVARTYHENIEQAKQEVKKMRLMDSWKKVWIATNWWYASMEGHKYEEVEVK